MRITAVTSAYRQIIAPAKGRLAEGASADEPRLKKKDRVEISAEARDRLQKIQDRLESGYYSSEAVSEDISDKLGKIFSDMDL
jgi:hypothetical protein